MVDEEEGEEEKRKWREIVGVVWCSQRSNFGPRRRCAAAKKAKLKKSCSLCAAASTLLLCRNFLFFFLEKIDPLFCIHSDCNGSLTELEIFHVWKLVDHERVSIVRTEAKRDVQPQFFLFRCGEKKGERKFWGNWQHQALPHLDPLAHLLTTSSPWSQVCPQVGATFTITTPSCFNHIPSRIRPSCPSDS